MLFLGLLLGARSTAWAWKLALRSQPSLPSAAPAPQYTSSAYLVVGVTDALGAPDSLEAIWIVSADGGGARLNLLGVLPSAEMRALFAGDPGALPDALAPLAPAPFSGQLVVDRQSLAAAVDLLGPVMLGGQLRTGREVLGYLDEAPNERERLLRQAATLQALLAYAALQRDALDVGQALGAVLRGDEVPAMFVQLARRFAPVDLTRIHVQVEFGPL